MRRPQVCSVIDFEAVIIDGGFSPSVKGRIVEATRKAMAKVNLQGIAAPVIEAGLVGASARAIGAASLPLFSRYHIDQSVLFKSWPDAQRRRPRIESRSSRNLARHGTWRRNRAGRRQTIRGSNMRGDWSGPMAMASFEFWTPFFR